MREMPLLLCYNRTVGGPLGLLSRNENGLTFALGFILTESPVFLRHFLELLGITRINGRGGVSVKQVKLQRHCRVDDARGITDLEVEGVDFYLIIEAKKRGWPTQDQLAKYAEDLAVSHAPQRILCALGVPPESESETRTWKPGGNVRFCHLRWYEILNVARATMPLVGAGARQLLSEFEDLIEEVIGMQSYNTEVLVRDIRFEHESRDLFHDQCLYNAGPIKGAEPLFFAPNFTKDAPLGMDGIQFISRVYYQDRFNIHDKNGARAALEKAKEIVDSRWKVLEKRKTTKNTVAYLKSLPGFWDLGVKKMPRIWKDKAVVTIFFLGIPMRLPVPVRKQGGMIVPGFSVLLGVRCMNPTYRRRAAA